MIRVRVRCGPGGAELTAQGHAGYAPAGQDIVCAAVSTLMQSLAYSVDSGTVTCDTSGDNILCVQASRSLDTLAKFAQGEGSTRIAARGERGTKSVARAAEILQGLAEQWPECLRVEETAFE